MSNTVAPTVTSGERVERLSVSALVFAVSVAFVVFGGLVSDNADFFRTHATAWTSALLATPSFYIFARHFGQEGLGDWWRLFWTFGWLMIVIHFYFGLGIMHFWNPVSVFQRQGIVIAAPIFLLQVTWLIDIVLAYTRRDWRRAAGFYKWWQLVAFLIAIANFFVSLVVFQNDLESLVIGIAVTAAVLLGFTIRFLTRDGAT